jgi:hypothetical protein
MANSKDDSVFGLDAKIISQIDWVLANKRILQDMRSDFIYAPHLKYIYENASENLTAILKKELSSGNYSPGVPLTLEVPKSSRMKVFGSQRVGPSFSRPGSIL